MVLQLLILQQRTEEEEEKEEEEEEEEEEVYWHFAAKSWIATIKHKSYLCTICINKNDSS